MLYIITRFCVGYEELGMEQDITVTLTRVYVRIIVESQMDSTRAARLYINVMVMLKEITYRETIGLNVNFRLISVV